MLATVTPAQETTRPGRCAGVTPLSLDVRRSRFAGRRPEAALRALAGEAELLGPALPAPAVQILALLAERAPGTFFHAQRVADVVGAVVGTDEARAAVLLHDIGKIYRTQAFGENSLDACRPSDATLIEHVAAGAELAADLELPALAQAAIREHHGTLPVSAEACYPGPRPQSFFTAVLMLADTFEAIDAQGGLTEDVAAAVLADRLRRGQFRDVDALAVAAAVPVMLAALQPALAAAA